MEYLLVLLYCNSFKNRYGRHKLRFRLCYISSIIYVYDAQSTFQAVFTVPAGVLDDPTSVSGPQRVCSSHIASLETLPP